MKKLLPVFLMIISIITAFALGEFFLRLRGFTQNKFIVNTSISGDSKYTFAEPDPVLGWINKQGTALAAEPGNASMNFWSGGRRATLSKDPKKNLKRAMVMGGSFTQGYGVPDQKTFSYLLDSRYPDISFDNYGNGGYSTIQSLLLLKRELASTEKNKKPDLVIYGYIPHHKDRNVATGNWIFSLTNSKGNWITPPYALLKGNGLKHYPSYIVKEWPFERYSALITLFHKKKILFQNRRIKDADSVTLRLIEEMKNFANIHGAKFLTVILYTSPNTMGGEDNIPQMLKEKGIEHITCIHPEWYTDRAKLKVGGIGHPNPLLHKFYADCISEWLDKNMF